MSRLAGGWIAATLLYVTVAAALAQDGGDEMSGARFGADARAKTGPSYQASLGTVTVGDTQVYRVSLRPEVPVGNLGLALHERLPVSEYRLACHTITSTTFRNECDEWWKALRRTA